MKVILNPENGAVIKNVQVKGQILFTDSVFEPDSLKKIEDDETAEDLLALFGFLQELGTKEEIESYLNEKKNRAYKCPKCNFASSAKIGLEGHFRKHDAEERLVDELGIEIVQRKEEKMLTPDQLEAVRAENERRHLDSMGITMSVEDDIPSRRGAVM